MVKVPCAGRRKSFLCLVTGVCYTPVARCAGKSELFMKPLDFWCAAVYISTRKL